MSETNVPATAGLNLSFSGALAALKPNTAVDETKVTSAGGRAYLQQMTIVNGQSKLANPPFDIQQGVFAVKLDRSSAIALGREIDVFIADVRPRAQRTQPDIAVSYEPDSELFQEIQSAYAAGVKWNVCGYDYLLLTRDGKFVTFFAGTATLNQISYHPTDKEKLLLFNRLNRAVRMKTDFISIPAKNQSWWGCELEECLEFSCETVTDDEFMRAVELFRNPKGTDEQDEEDGVRSL